MAYTIFGPFVNGSSPGISSSFLNPLETFVASINSAATDANITADGTGMETLKWLKVNPTAVVQNGSTSGSMTLYQPLRGTVKLAVIVFANFRNNGGSTQGVTLPTAFTGRSKIWTGDLPSTGISFQASGVSQSVAVVITLAAAGGTSSNVTVLNGKSQGEILSGWDTMIVPTGGTGVTDGVIVVLGT